VLTCWKLIVFIELFEDLLAAICEDLLAAVALEAEFDEVGALLSGDEVHAVVVVVGTLVDIDVFGEGPLQYLIDNGV